MTVEAPVDRRDFFNQLGLGTYSLVVLAGEADAQTRTPASADFDKIAPRDAAFAAAGTAHARGPAGSRRPRGRRRSGGRVRGDRSGASRSARRSGAGSLPAGRQLLERSEDARGGRQPAHGAAGLARERADRRIAARRRGQQSAALLGAVGSAALRQSRERAQHHSAARNDGLLGEREGRPHHGGGGALRQERTSLPHSRRNLLRLHGRFAPRPRSRRRNAHRAAKRAPSSANRWRPRRPKIARWAPAFCSRRACITTRCRSRPPFGRARLPRNN